MESKTKKFLTSMKKKKMLIPMVALLIFSGTVLAVTTRGTWFTWIEDYVQPILDYFLSLTSWILNIEPPYPQYVEQPSMTITGSGYVGVEHDVEIAISQSRPDVDAYNYWLLNCNVRAYLIESDETIAQYAIEDLANDGPHIYTGTWTPTSADDTYQLALNVTDYAWDEHHDAIYSPSAFSWEYTVYEAGVSINAVAFSPALPQLGGTVTLSFNLILTVDALNGQYRILDNGAQVVGWTPWSETSGGTYPQSKGWTVPAPTGPHTVLLEVQVPNP